MSERDLRRLEVAGAELAFVDAGDPAAPPVVLIGGHLTSSYQWRDLVPMLSPWMRVIAPDLPGRGDSPLAADADLSLRGHAGTIRALLDELGVERCAAVGHGYGGGIAQLLAVEDGVAAVVLIDSIAFDAWPSARMREIQGALRIADPSRVEAWVRGAFEVGMSHRDLVPHEAIEEYLRPFRGEEGVGSFARVLSAIDGEGLRGLEPRLSALDVPALVLWGEDDAFLAPALAERLGDALPRASIALFPGCGHFLLEDAGATVAPMVFQWLRRNYLGIEHRHGSGPVEVFLGRRPPGEGG